MQVSAVTLNSLGLALDILGALLLFRFGLPPSFDPQGRSFLLLEQDSPEEKAMGVRYRKWSRAAVTLLVLGFALQLASNYW